MGAEMGSGLPDVWWFRADGRRMTQRDWARADAHTLGVFLNGQEIPTRTPQGAPIADDSFLLLLNAHHEPVEFTLPARRFGLRWATELSTAEPEAPARILPARGRLGVESRSLVLLRRDFRMGAEMGAGLPDVWWFRPDGRRMTQRDWARADAHTLGVFLNGQEIPTRTPQGAPIADDSFLLLLNAHHEPVEFTLPARRFGLRWELVLSTGGDGEGDMLQPRAALLVPDRSLTLLRRAF